MSNSTPLPTNRCFLTGIPSDCRMQMATTTIIKNVALTPPHIRWGLGPLGFKDLIVSTVRAFSSHLACLLASSVSSSHMTSSMTARVLTSNTNHADTHDPSHLAQAATRCSPSIWLTNTTAFSTYSSQVPKVFKPPSLPSYMSPESLQFKQ